MFLNEKNLVFSAKFSSENFFFPFEKHSEREICSSLLPLTKKQSVSKGNLLQALLALLLAAVSLALGFPA